MKLLIIPIVIALLAGIGGGSGYAYMRASKSFVVDSAQRADSLKAHPPKPKADSTAAEPELHDVVPDSVEHEVPAPETPADSLRALAAARTALKDGTKGLHDAVAPHEADEHGAKPVLVEKASGAKAEPSHGKPAAQRGTPGDAARESKVDAAHEPKAVGAHEPKAESAHEPKADAMHEAKAVAGRASVSKTEGGHGASASAPVTPTTHGAEPDAKSNAAAHSGKSVASTGAVAAALRDARNDAMSTALPEQRLAKIFGAMPVKEAAKVMDQMSDDDVRTILGMMSDRQAAAILTALPAPRVAAITRGATRTPDGKP